MNSPQEFARWLPTCEQEVEKLVCLIGGCPALYVELEQYKSMRDEGPMPPPADVFAYVPADTPGAPRTGWFILDPRGEEL